MIGTSRTREVADLIDKIRPMLAGRPVETQGCVLADCLALWIAGHHVAGDEAATRLLREELLRFHLAQVRELITVNAAILGVP
jgi:hypothetical protein